MTKSSVSKNEPSAVAQLDPKPLDAIGRALRAHYDDLLREPLPVKFHALLSRLDAAEERTKRNSA